MTSNEYGRIQPIIRWITLAVCVAAFLPLVRVRAVPWWWGPRMIAGVLLLVFWWYATADPSPVQRRWPKAWAWGYFGGHLLLFGGLLMLPVPRLLFWILAMPGVAAARVALPLAGSVAVALAYLGLFARYLRGVNRNWASTADNALLVGVGIAFTYLATGLAVWADGAREKAQALAAQLAAANERLRQAAAQTAELAAAHERNRIARDIHDGLGHSLTAIAVQLQAARALLPAQPERAGEAVKKAEHASRAALDEVRHSIGALRESAARPLLAEAVAELVRESGLAAELLVKGPARALPEDVERALFRVAQEGLTNVRKHAGPARVEVVLEFRAAGGVRLQVDDSGRGPGQADGRGFGLKGLGERVAAVGGTLVAGPRPGGGFALVAEVPT